MITEKTEEKIKRRAARAWSYHDEGEMRRVHRITNVSDGSLRYRLRHKSGESCKGGKKIKVSRTEKGEILVPAPPQAPSPDAFDLSDLAALENLATQRELGEMSDDQRVRAYKVTTKEATGYQYPTITYEVGEEYEEPNANTDEKNDCAEGINVATLEWAKGQWKDSYRLFAVEFDAEDVAALPVNRSSKLYGKFRVFRCVVVEELDLVDIGLKARSTWDKAKGLLGMKDEDED